MIGQCDRYISQYCTSALDPIKTIKRNYLEGPLSSALSFIGGVHIGARALLDINLIWFGYIACLSKWGGGRYFTRSNDYYLPSLHLEEGGGRVSTMWRWPPSPVDQLIRTISQMMII